MSLSDVKYVPGIVVGVAVLVGILGPIWAGLLWFVASQPAVLLAIPVLGAVAWVYTRFDEATHPDRIKYPKP